MNAGEELELFYVKAAINKNIIKEHEYVEEQKSCKPCSLEALNGKTTIEIMDVGQGSWNRIACKYCDKIFDCGCSVFYSRNQCKDLISRRGGIPRAGRTTSLIISHWDVDHFNLLCALEDDELNELCCVFVPNKLNSLTNASKNSPILCRWLR